jgi:hypothetical protein
MRDIRWPDGRCRACLSPLPPLRYQGNPRRWCSESCRQWAIRNPGQIRIREQRRCAFCLDPIPTSRAPHARYCAHPCRLAAEGHLGRGHTAELLERRAVNEHADSSNRRRAQLAEIRQQIT